MDKWEALDMLASGMTVRVPARQVYEWVDHFWDSGHPSNPEQTNEELMEQKMDECSEAFIMSVMELGIRTPCDVSVHLSNDDSDGRLEF